MKKFREANEDISIRWPVILDSLDDPGGWRCIGDGGGGMVKV